MILSKKVVTLVNFEHKLEQKASKAGQLDTERKRQASDAEEKKLIQKQIDGIREDIKLLTQQRDKLNFDSKEYEELDASIKKLRKEKIIERYTYDKTELERLPSVMIELKTSQKNLSDVFNNEKIMKIELKELTKIEGRYTRAKQLYDKVLAEFNDNKTAFATESEREKQAVAKLNDLNDKEQKLKKNLKQIEQHTEEITTLGDLQNIFKNIPPNILRRLRPFIEKEGTDIINDLSDSDLTALNIEDETLNIAATTNGEIQPIHYFSGGQKTRINMALRVAISRILSKMPQTEEHTFAIMQTLFIDEGDFGNLDEGGIRDAVNVIRNLTKEFDRVILISHVSTIKEIFQGYTIEVQKTGIEQSAIRIA